MDELLKLLIVDDEPLARRRILSFDLKRHGYEIAGEAENGRQALDMIAALKPDIVITDIVMPVMDGLGLLEEIQKLTNPPKVILLTCYDDFSKAQAALRLGAQDYIVKIMLKEEEFVDVINKVNRLISMEKRALYKAIRKSLYDLMLSESAIYSGEYIKQLEDMGFALEHFRVLLLEFNAFKMQTIEACKLSIEKWEGGIRCIVVSISARQWLVLLFTPDAATVCEFDAETRSLCRKLSDEFSSSYAGEIPACRIVLGNVYTGIQHLPEAYNMVLSARAQLFYAAVDEVILEEESGRDLFDSMPEDEFYSVVSRLRDYCLDNQGAEAAECMLSWLKLITMKYRLQPEDLKLMASLLSACIPVNVSIILKDGIFCPLRHWLKGQVEEAAHIKDIGNAFEIAADCLTDNLKNSESFMRSEVKRALEFVHENFNRDVNLEAAAEYVNLSSSWFGTLFRSETGQTFSEYLTAYRMRIAKRLLAGTDLSIQQVAENVGIQDPHYFSRVFAKSLGQSPKKFRNSLRIK